MEPRLFDQISQHFSERRLSRRAALGTGLAAGAAAMTGVGTTAAQDATPVATPEGTALAPEPTELFVQAFRSGSIAPATGEFGTHTVTLAQGMGQTIVFADRPSRNVSTTPTPAFLAGLGFDADNPPNAAMLLDAGGGVTDIAVVELYNPTYDEATHTATYDIAVLANWQNDLELGFQEEPLDLSNVVADFGVAHLFIDGCPSTLPCAWWNDGHPDVKGYLQDVPATRWWDRGGKCIPDGTAETRTLDEVYAYWATRCNEAIPACEGRCALWS